MFKLDYIDIFVTINYDQYIFNFVVFLANITTCLFNLNAIYKVNLFTKILVFVNSFCSDILKIIMNKLQKIFYAFIHFVCYGDINIK